MPAPRICGNPLCGQEFTPRRVDAFYCGSTCRGEATRLRALLNPSAEQGKAVRSALHKREQPRKKKGSRPDTGYAVIAIEHPLVYRLAGFASAHDRGAAVRQIAGSDEGTTFVPIPQRAFRPLDRNGEPLPE